MMLSVWTMSAVWVNDAFSVDPVCCGVNDNNNNNNDNECDDFDKKSAKRIRPYFSRSVHSDTGFETLACAASQYAR